MANFNFQNFLERQSNSKFKPTKKEPKTFRQTIKPQLRPVPFFELPKKKVEEKAKAEAPKKVARTEKIIDLGFTPDMGTSGSTPAFIAKPEKKKKKKDTVLRAELAEGGLEKIKARAPFKPREKEITKLTREFGEKRSEKRQEAIEKGTLFSKVAQFIKPEEADIIDDDFFKRTGSGMTKYGDLVTKDSRTGELTYILGPGEMAGNLKNVARKGLTKTKQSLFKRIKSFRLPFKQEKAAIELVSENVEKRAKPFIVDDYIKENITKRNAARKSATGGMPGKVQDFFALIKRKGVDKFAPIEDVLNVAERKGKFQVLPQKDIRAQIDMVLRAPAIAEQFAKKEGLAEVIKEVPKMANLDQYLIAKRAIEVTKEGIETGRNLVKDKMLVEQLKNTYEPFAKKVNNYSRKLLDEITDAGLISKKLNAHLKKKYPNYVPLQRVFNEMEKSGADFGSSAVASLSKQSIVQKSKGSAREIESPLESLLSKTNESFRQLEKNKAASILADMKNLPGNPYGLKPLRTAEKIKKRISILSELKEMGIKNRELRRKVPVLKKRQRILGKEIKEIGMVKESVSIKKTREVLRSTEKEMESLFEQAKVFASEFEIKSKINSLLNKAETRERNIFKINSKLNKLLNDFNKKLSSKVKIKSLDLQIIKDTRKQLEQLLELRVDDVKNIRKSLKNISDIKKAPDKDTFSFLKDGVKETWETSREIAEAAKQMNPQQMNILTKAFAVPVRVGRLGITGVNVAFTLANAVKDQIFAAIVSKNPFKTSIANPVVFMKSLLEALRIDKKSRKAFDEFVSSGAGGTSFDIARVQTADTLKKIRSQKNIASRALYTVTRPAELLRAVENLVGRGEELTRLMQFNGTKKAMLAKGATEETATILAAKAARENTANFLRHGEWNQVLGGAFMYLNANIQGTRAWVKPMRNNPVKTSGRIATSLLFPAAIITAWNVRDEEKKKVYDDIPEYEKENNFIIIPDNVEQDENGKWNIIKIPLPAGISQLTIPVRKMVEGTKDKEILKSIINSVSPVDVDKPLASLVPQALKPTVQYAANYDFFTGYATVPDYMKELSPAEQKRKDTSGSMQKIGDKFDVSPLKAEKFVKDTFGETGMNVLNLVDRALAGLDIIPDEQIGGRSYSDSIIRRFKKAAGGATDSKQNEKLSKILQENADANYKLKTEAEVVYEELVDLPKEEQKVKLKTFKKTDPALYKKIINSYKETELGLTHGDKMIKRLGVENGARSKFIFEEYKVIETKDDKKIYLKDLRKKKVISDNVWEQLKDLIKEDNAK